MRILKITVVFFIFCAISIDSSLSTKCGLKKSKDWWPWVVRILRIQENESKLICSGTLVSLNSVLSSASCFQVKGSQNILQPSDVKVQLGKHYNSSSFEGLKTISPESIIVHHDWNSTVNKHDKDLALLTFREKIEATDFISPVCLRPSVTLIPEGKIVGWRICENNCEVVDEIPMENDVVKTSNDECHNLLGKLVTFSSNKTFCASNVLQDSFALFGLSGSGYFTKSEEKWFIDGVVSLSPSQIKSKKNESDLLKQLLITQVNNPIQCQAFEFETKKLQCEVKVEYIHGLTCKIRDMEIIKRCTKLYFEDNAIYNNASVVKIEDQNIYYLPLNLGKLFPELRVLKVKNSQLKIVDIKYFWNMKNLKVLDLPSNLIENIPPYTFHNLSNLQELDISRNSLKYLHPRTFWNNKQLMDIDASNNEIVTIAENLFKYNSKLKSIDFSNNKIEKVNFRFDERFTSVDLYLMKNSCFDQMFFIEDGQSFNEVNRMLARNCSSDTSADLDYQGFFDY